MMDDRPRVKALLVDDEEDYMLAKDMLSHIESVDLSLEWVATYEEGMEAIRRGGYDVYLLDQHLGSGTGLDLLRQGIGWGRTEPMIMLTGTQDRTVEERAMRAGAADYVDKSDVLPWLELAVRHVLASRGLDQPEQQRSDDVQSSDRP